ARRRDQTTSRTSCEGCDGALDLGRVAKINGFHIDANRTRHGLDDGELTDARSLGRIPKNSRSCHVRRDPFKEFQPFRAQIIFEHHEASGIAAWLREALDISSADWIRNDYEHDRYGAGCLQYGCNARIAGRQDNVRCKSDQFRRVFAGDGGITSGPADLDAHVTTFRPTQLPQGLEKYRVTFLSIRKVGGQRREHADTPHSLALLR